MQDTAIQRGMELALTALRKLGGSPLLDKAGLRSGTERFIERSATNAFTAGAELATRLNRLDKKGPKTRPTAGAKPDRFDLTPTEEQELMSQMLRRFAASEMRPVAEAADDACEPPAELLAKATELGLAFMAVPESQGGGGTERSVVSNALATEALAHGDMGLALAILSPVSVINAIAEWGDGRQQASLLPQFAGEEFVAASLAVVERNALFDWDQLTTRARRSPDEWVLYGEKALVPLASTAAFFLVLAEVAGAGPHLFIVDRNTPGLEITVDPAMGLRSAGLGKLTLSGVTLPRTALLGGEVNVFDAETFRARARLASAALAIGCAQAVLDHVIPFANERVAFGAPISHRQAVAFMIADMGIELEGMRLLNWRAAGRVDAGMAAHREAFLAALFCAEKGMKIGTDGVQVLGGAGYIKDHPVERWYRHLRGAAVIDGQLML